MSNLIGFTSNFADNSTEAGFQFTFFCDTCREGYKTRFTESSTYKKKKFFKGLGDVISAVASIAGQNSLGSTLERGTNAISAKFTGMSPEWHKEHEAAFELAQNEAKGHFTRCPKCSKWACGNCWNEQEGLCVKDAPRANVEIAAAKSQKMVEDIQAAAASTPVFTGKIESKQTICFKCGKPSGEGKFCNNCGASLELPKCPACGKPSQQGARFCGECGAKF
ncbi:MAG: zinc ribbon domain-containing protein [Elusimicrobiales bacterium]|nr:zinc ribbon domain-containing protein [Elusimicrobiales bacterium]